MTNDDDASAEEVELDENDKKTFALISNLAEKIYVASFARAPERHLSPNDAFEYAKRFLVAAGKDLDLATALLAKPKKKKVEPPAAPQLPPATTVSPPPVPAEAPPAPPPAPPPPTVVMPSPAAVPGVLVGSPTILVMPSPQEAMRIAPHDPAVTPAHDPGFVQPRADAKE